MVTTTTQVAFDPQDATRTWLISADASPEQTGRIIDYKLDRAAEPPELLEALGRTPEDLAPVVQETVSLLDYGATVVVAYADELRTLLSSQVVRARRDVEQQALGLIASWPGSTSASAPRLRSGATASSTPPPRTPTWPSNSGESPSRRR